MYESAEHAAVFIGEGDGIPTCLPYILGAEVTSDLEYLPQSLAWFEEWSLL
ncbi:hypothetical protein DL93DRAFT_371617 [Clavulina sp. PMI_390]|nr:hypothetical protein DL93DRAFT_371617 [Clavulina sp. PMI_390]